MINHFFSFTETAIAPALDMGFLVSATVSDSSETVQYMKSIMKNIVELYGSRRIQYALVTYGDEANTR